MALKIKKDDKVKVMVGRDAGKEGKVVQVFPKINKILVENINIVKKHLKPTREHQGGIIDKPMPLDWSKVQLVCPRCNKPTRVGFSILKDKKVRTCKKCKENIDK